MSDMLFGHLIDRKLNSCLFWQSVFDFNLIKDLLSRADFRYVIFELL